jgi:hypothetical protein
MEKLNKNWKEKPYLKGLIEPRKQYSSTIALVWGLDLMLKTKLTITKALLLKRIKGIETLDPLVAFCVLFALVKVEANPSWWMLYAFGCSLCMILMIGKKLYFQAIMNFVALIIAVGNFIKG